jgi:hypothetical protein
LERGEYDSPTKCKVKNADGKKRQQIKPQMGENVKRKNVEKKVKDVKRTQF